MKTLRFLKDARADCPDEWLDMDEAIQELEEFEARKCSNCKHCDEVKASMIHCSNFEEYLPAEIGKCDMWESLDDKK